MVSEYQTGVTLPYEKVAISGGELPDGLSSADKWMFLCLRSLYHQIRNGVIDRITAVAEKRRLLDEYQQMIFHEQVQAGMVDAWKQIEMLVCDYRKNPSIETADKVMEALYGGVKRKV